MPEPPEPPSSDDVRLLISRVDARYQAVRARFTTGDRRLAGVVRRVDDIEGTARSLTERFGAHSRSEDDRFDAIDTRVDLVHDILEAGLDQLRRDQCHRLLLTAVVMTAVGAIVTTGCWVWLA